MPNILHLDASARHNESFSRKLSKQVVDKIRTVNSTVTYRDVGQGLPFVDEPMIESYFTPPEDRSEEQRQRIVLSDQITQELLDCDSLVIGVPIYNFSMPAALKAWCDLAARVGVTFKYTEHGPVGLLENKKAYIAVVSGGTPVGSEIDFLTPWLRHYLTFIGINDIEMIPAERVQQTPTESMKNAEEKIQLLG